MTNGEADILRQLSCQVAAMDATLTALQRHVDQRFDSQDVATKNALISADKAVEKAQELATARAAEDRERQETADAVISLALPRADYEKRHDDLVKQIGVLADRMNVSMGRGLGGSATVAWVIAGLSVVIAVGTLVLRLFGV